MGILVKEPDFFGLDIGSTGIRLVQLRHSGNKPLLAAYGHIAATGNVTTSDSRMDQDKVSELIRQLVKENKISTKNVVAGLPSSKVFATVITTPKLDNAQLAKAIRFQAEQYIPMALDQVKLDYSVIEQGKDGKTVDVLLVAAPNTAVDKYVSILENAGLEPLALEANPIATARALVAPGNNAVAILDLSSLESDISIVYNGSPRLIRNVAVGGSTFVRTVAQSLGLDEVQASQFTYKFGLAPGKLEGQVLKSIKPALENLVSEIDKSVTYFKGRYPDVKLEKLVVTGSPSAIPELGSFLANSTSLPVEFANAWVNVSYPSGLNDKLMGLSSEYAAAVGLAGRGYIA